MASMLPPSVSPTGRGPEQKSATASPVAHPEVKTLGTSTSTTQKDSRTTPPTISDVSGSVRRRIPGQDLPTARTPDPVTRTEAVQRLEPFRNPWESDNAWRSFLAEEWPKLMNRALALTHDVDAAQDLVQTALEKVVARINNPDTVIENLPAYIDKTLVTTFISSRRGQRQLQEVSMDAQGPSSTDALKARLPATDNVEDKTIESEAVHELLKTLREAGAPKEQLEVLVFQAFGNLSPKEIAETLGIPEGTIRSRLSQIRARAREALPNIDTSERHLKWKRVTNPSKPELTTGTRDTTDVSRSSNLATRRTESTTPLRSNPTLRQAVLLAYTPGVDGEIARRALRHVKASGASSATISRIKSDLRSEGHDIPNGHIHPHISALRDAILAANQPGITAVQRRIMIKEAQKVAGVSSMAVSRVKRILRSQGHKIW